jgi:nucleotide-binding universal stress UspA family protein
MNKIIVGTDGSEPSLLAVDRAAAEAGRRGALPHVVYVVAPWLFDVPDDPGAAQVREQMLRDGLFTGLLPGSVGQAMLRAHGPVAIVPARA